MYIDYYDLRIKQGGKVIWFYNRPEYEIKLLLKQYPSNQYSRRKFFKYRAIFENDNKN